MIIATWEPGGLGEGRENPGQIRIHPVPDFPRGLSHRHKVTELATLSPQKYTLETELC